MEPVLTAIITVGAIGLLAGIILAFGPGVVLWLLPRFFQSLNAPRRIAFCASNTPAVWRRSTTC